MGKLKFTLSNIWLWLALAGVSILTENLQFLTSDMKGGLNFAPVFIIGFIGIVSLFMFFFINHKENKMTFDYVMLPIFVLGGVLLISAIWLQTDLSLNNVETGEAIVVSVSTFEKLRATLGVLMFLPFMYGLMFTFQRTQPHSKNALITAYIGVAFVYVAIIYSLITERNAYLSIFSDEAPKKLVNIVSFFGNKNYYGGLIFVGILTCMIINYHRPRFIWYMSIVFMFVILVSTAASIPSLIALVAVPVYLVEEIVRSCVRRKYLVTLFATIAVLTFLSLFLVFYIGTVLEWKGFNGLDWYVTDVIYSKDFKTLTGRTKIWKAVLEYCFDTPLHTVLGHGFMISQEYTRGITGAFSGTSFTSGSVRTTHNGYIQVLFDFGLIGVFIHLVLILYFVYALIRMLIEGRYHFAFVYGFVALCFAAYNCGESSYFFGYGIKEIFMTSIVMCPVMARAKLLTHRHVVEETKELPLQSMQLDPIKIGKGLSAIIVSIMFAIIPLFLVQFTSDNSFMREILILAEVCLGIAWLFIPYLVSLYYRDTIKPFFVLHCVGNGALLALIGLGCGLVPTMLGYADLAKVILPIAVVVFFLFDTFVYVVIKRANVIEWARILFVGGFAHPAGGIICSLVFGIGLYCSLQNFGAMNWFTYLFGVIINLMVFYIGVYFIPVIGKRDIINEFNKVSLYHNKKCTIKDDTVYG